MEKAPANSDSNSHTAVKPYSPGAESESEVIFYQHFNKVFVKVCINVKKACGKFERCFFSLHEDLFTDHSMTWLLMRKNIEVEGQEWDHELTINYYTVSCLFIQLLLCPRAARWHLGGTLLVTQLLCRERELLQKLHQVTTTVSNQLQLWTGECGKTLLQCYDLVK